MNTMQKKGLKIKANRVEEKLGAAKGYMLNQKHIPVESLRAEVASSIEGDFPDSSTTRAKEIAGLLDSEKRLQSQQGCLEDPMLAINTARLVLDDAQKIEHGTWLDILAIIKTHYWHSQECKKRKREQGD